jgi:hypothetical protein
MVRVLVVTFPRAGKDGLCRWLTTAELHQLRELRDRYHLHMPEMVGPGSGWYKGTPAHKFEQLALKRMRESDKLAEKLVREHDASRSRASRTLMSRRDRRGLFAFLFGVLP